MYNKELFNKICNVSCSYAELEDFVTAIDKKEFDLENPFKKYYNVDKIILAIEKYQNKEIDAKFLACWMCAYNWVIMGGFKIKKEDNSFSLKEFLLWEIIDWIDSLSFFDDSDDFYNLEDYKNTYKVLDSVLQDVDHCNAVFAKHGYNEDEVIVLVVNDSAKYFIKIYGELDYINNKIAFKQVEPDNLNNRAKQLLELNYRELIYCTWDNWEDED